MTVYKRPDRDNAWWVDVTIELPNGTVKRVRKRCPINKKKEAGEYELALRRSILDGSYGAAGSTFAEAAARWLTEHADAKCRPRTAARYHELVAHLLPVLGEMDIAAIDLDDIDRAHRAIGAKPGRGAGKATGTANRALLCASAIFNWCELRKLRPAGSNPTKGVERFEERGAGYYYSAAELARISAVLDEGHFAPSTTRAIRFCMLSACRLSDAADLMWDDVDLEREQLVLRDSKSGRSIRPLPPGAVTFLRGLKRSGAYVCACEGGGPPLASNIDRAWRSIRARAKLPAHARLHDLRHSAASLALESGVPLPLVAAMLGHKSVATTARTYAHVLVADLSKFGDAQKAALARGKAENRAAARKGKS